MTRARILLADDNDLFREGVAGLIDAQADLQVVGQAEDGLEALALVRERKPDLIIMDINMPKLDGVAVAELLHKEAPKTKDAPYVFDSTGDLTIAGTTKTIKMPVNILPVRLAPCAPVQATSPGSLQDLGMFVLGNDPLHLQQQFFVGTASDGTINKDRPAPFSLQFFQQAVSQWI